MVTKWVEEKGSKPTSDFPLVRGQVANFPEQSSSRPMHQGIGPGLMGGMSPGMGGMPPGIMGPMPPGGAAPGLGPPAGSTGAWWWRWRRGHGAAPAGGAVQPAAPLGGGRGAARGRVPPGGRDMLPPGMMPPGVPGGGMPTPADATNEIDVVYITGATAIDFRGGQRLAGRKGNSLGLSAAGEMLLLDPDGTLVVRNELDDEPACKELTKAEDEAARQRAAGPLAPPAEDLRAWKVRRRPPEESRQDSAFWWWPPVACPALLPLVRPADSLYKSPSFAASPLVPMPDLGNRAWQSVLFEGIPSCAANPPSFCGVLSASRF